jgi:CRISPR type I-E-associated protein CasA/Cse1
MQFNVLRDPWVPLDRDGAVEYASVAEVLCGKKDAPDLIHPRDDVRFFARMLLSALAQSLFTPENRKELRRRIDKPMSKAEFEQNVASCADDFELVGSGKRPGFLQDLGGKNEDGTEYLLLDLVGHVLFRSLPDRDPARSVGLCVPCAVPLLYGVQSFAASGGRGYSPSVRGRPATTTLIGEPSLRGSIWANVLHAESLALLPFARRVPARPWLQKKRELEEDERLSITEGLFWQPRALWLVPMSAGRCAACGAEAARLGVRGFSAKSKAGAAFFPHPYSPTRVRTKKGKALTLHLHLRHDRPAWTGLVDVLGEVSDGGAGRPAPVVEQWRDSLDEPTCSLLVLDYATDQASFVGRVSEAFPLSRRHLENPALQQQLRGFVTDAETSSAALRTALKRAHSSRSAKPKAQRDGFWAADAEAAFWQETEPAFWAAYRLLMAGKLDSSRAFRQELGRVALRLFDAHTRVSIDDPSRVDVIVRARRRLRRALAEMIDPETSHPKAPAPVESSGASGRERFGSGSPARQRT